MSRRELYQSDEQVMLRCLELAQCGLGHVAPNPMVGSVITYKGHIIGQGFHERLDGPLAEVNAINSVHDKTLLPESKLYINLEPYYHKSNLSPGIDLILNNKIPEVVVGCRNTTIRGYQSGIDHLSRQGVKTHYGILEKDCFELNKRFFTFHTLHRPYIILKWAEAADGFVAREDHPARSIISEQSRVLLHRWRSEESATVIGTNTALFDNPQLTVRHVPGTNPIRIVMDRTRRLPPDLNLFDGSVRTLVFNEEEDEIKNQNLEYVKVDFEGNILDNLMNALYQRDILSCIVEGGARLINSFVLCNLWDEARVFVSPKKLGMGLRGPLQKRKDCTTSKIGSDELRIFRNH